MDLSLVTCAWVPHTPCDPHPQSKSRRDRTCLMKTECSSKSNPFRILPLLSLKMPKNPNLKLFTKTWPPKKDSKKEERPLTATLDKPTVLNISLMGIIDMSTVRKEFLNISNLCKLTVVRTKTAVIGRPLSLPGPEKGVRSAKGKDANNNQKKGFRIPKKAKLGKLPGEVRGSKLPEPCKACGRPDQPERFHSHPETAVKSVKKDEVPKMKSTVQKPMAMKYKSKQSEKKALPLANPRKSSLPSQKLVHTPPEGGTVSSGTPRAKSAKRLLTCYICSREFGTASLPLHEPKCLQKWERENALLPLHLQRKPPLKPSSARSAEEYNRVAWESSQSQLVGCPSCGRTFYPDRLLVHQRICKGGQDPSKSASVEKASIMPPPNIECYICGKMFGHHSIKIHERQCLKKWHTENDALPPDIRAPEPQRKEVTNNDRGKPQKVPSPRPSEERPSSGRKAPMFPCYICGRLFTVNSIYIHEPQCLKMWKIENEKLPLSKRRPQPLKPDIKFTQDGKIDYTATNEANWQSHLSQLVPCRICSRTFNPDRVVVHEKSCKG